MKPGHHTWPFSGEEHPVWVKHEEEPVEDYKNRMKEYITDLLYKKNLIKNKNIPHKLLLHIYVNFLNDDLDIVFL